MSVSSNVKLINELKCEFDAVKETILEGCVSPDKLKKLESSLKEIKYVSSQLKSLISDDEDKEMKDIEQALADEKQNLVSRIVLKNILLAFVCELFKCKKIKKIYSRFLKLKIK
jgi:hypothetical protein